VKRFKGIYLKKLKYTKDVNECITVADHFECLHEFDLLQVPEPSHTIYQHPISCLWPWLGQPQQRRSSNGDAAL